MKKIFSVLAICTMLLCISSVSYGADVTPTVNSDEVTMTVNFDVTADVVAVADVSFDNDVSITTDNYTSDIIASAPLSITIEYFDNRIDHCYSYLNNYTSLLATAPEPDQSEGYPSNHVGKLIAGNASILNNLGNYNRITTNVGKSGDNLHSVKLE